MLKKVLLSFLITFVLIFSTSFCFASEEGKSESTSKDLGSELTDSMNKTKDSASNMINGAKNILTNDNRIDSNNENRTDGFVTDEMNNGYNAVRTSVQNTTETMDTSTWLWVVIAVAGVLIVMAIWFFAMQSND